MSEKEWRCSYRNCVAPTEHPEHGHPTDKGEEIQPKFEILLAPIIHYPKSSKGDSMITPIYDRIAIRRVEQESNSPIIIPDNAKEKSLIGEVISIGRGRMLENGSIIPPAVNPGDKVLIGKYSGAEVEVDRETFIIIREDDILGIIK